MSKTIVLILQVADNANPEDVVEKITQTIHEGDVDAQQVLADLVEDVTLIGEYIIPG